MPPVAATTKQRPNMTRATTITRATSPILYSSKEGSQVSNRCQMVSSITEVSKVNELFVD